MYSAPPRDLIHVRKTVTFTGAAGAGAVGTVTVFTITGRVYAERFTGFASTGLTSAGGGNVALGTASQPSGFVSAVAATNIATNDFWAAASNVPGQQSGDLTGTTPTPDTLSEDIIITVTVGAVTAGVIVLDIWYRPITDGASLVAA